MHKTSCHDEHAAQDELQDEHPGVNVGGARESSR